MMRAGGIIAIASFVLAAPLAAQQDERYAPAFAPEDDLDCAMYVGSLLAEGEGQMTADGQAALTSAFTYFTGRYEARAGIDLVEAFTNRYPEYLKRDARQIEQLCSVRMRAFAVRLQNAGGALGRLQRPVEPTEAPESSAPTGE